MSAKTHSFVALYVGDSISTARLISASANVNIVRWVAEHLLHDEQEGAELDIHVKALREGSHRAISLILAGTEKTNA